MTARGPSADRRDDFTAVFDDVLANGVIAEGEQHGHGLRSRAGHVVAANGPVGVAGAERAADRLGLTGAIEEDDFLDLMPASIPSLGQHFHPSHDDPRDGHRDLNSVVIGAGDVEASIHART